MPTVEQFAATLAKMGVHLSGDALRVAYERFCEIAER